jgi:hypothetical protein
MVSKEGWFRKLVKWADIVYIPRYAYPLIPVAKALGKRVVVHLHDYQPILYTAVIFHNDCFKRDFERTFHSASSTISSEQCMLVVEIANYQVATKVLQARCSCGTG